MDQIMIETYYNLYLFDMHVWMIRRDRVYYNSDVDCCTT